MKKFFFASVLFIFSANCYSQAWMDNLSNDVCNCIANLPDSLKPEEAQMKLGLCMIEAAYPYKKGLKKEYGINMDKIDTQGEELGKIIGLKAAMKCPDTFMKLVNIVEPGSSSSTKSLNATETTESSDPKLESNQFSGKVSKIDSANFIVFSVRSPEGKTEKFYWITKVSSQTDLTNNYNKFLTKEVNLSYYSQEIFDPRINEYRWVKVLSELDYK